MSKILDVENEYINKMSWLVRENANVNESAITLFWYVSKSYVLEDVLKYLPQRAVKAHKEGWIHINKLLDGSFYLPYCCGLDTARVLMLGLRTPNIVSNPAKHLDSVVDHLVNLVYMFAQERTGAIGLNAVDLYLAPFVRHDGLNYKQVRQCVQRFIYNLNYTARIGYQCPFSNVTFALGVKEYYNMPAIVAGKTVGRLGDYVDEAKIVLKAFLDVYLEGDAYHRVFTFPIPTVMWTRDLMNILEEDAELNDLFWRCVAERGQLYFLNGFSTDVSGIFSFCCRLTTDVNKVMRYLHLTKGMWVFPPSTGSIGYVTINLPRIGIASVSKGDFEKYVDELLYEHMMYAREVLMWLRNRYTKLHKLGYYPLTRVYVDERDPFKYYYNTIAVTGMAEFDRAKRAEAVVQRGRLGRS